MTMTLCLDCGARRGGIGGANCLVCGSMRLELRRGHELKTRPIGGGLTGRYCVHCYTVPRDGAWLWIDGGCGWSHAEPDCETVAAINAMYDS